MAIKISKESVEQKREYLNKHSKLIKSIFIGIGLLLAILIGYLLIEEHTIVIPKEKIEEEIAKKLPMHIKKQLLLTSYVNTDINKVDVEFKNGAISGTIQGDMEVHLIKSRFSKLNLSFNTDIDFKTSTDSISIYLKPYIKYNDKIDFKLEDGTDSKKVNEIVNNNMPYINDKIREYLTMKPVYTYVPNDTTKKAIITSIKSIKVVDNGVEIKYSFMKLFLIITITIVVVGLIIAAIIVAPGEIFFGIIEAFCSIGV